MSEPITVDILSDDDDDDKIFSSPPPPQPKRQRTTPTKPISNPNTTILLIDDDTPLKQPNAINTPSFVPETPMSDSPLKNHHSFLKSCNFQPGSSSLTPEIKSSEINGLICLESDNESDFVSPNRFWKKNETTHVACEAAKEPELTSRFIDSTFSLGNASSSQMSGDSTLHPVLSDDDVAEVHDRLDEEVDISQPISDASIPNGRNKGTPKKKGKMDDMAGRKRTSQEEKDRLMEEKKQKKEQEKLEKAALKAEAMEMKKQQKEMQKWEKGKLALKSIVAEIDTKVVELGSVGGHLLTRFAEKGVSYRITSNPIERSIVWTMTVPEPMSQISSPGIEIPYVLIVYEAGEFCNQITNGSLMDHVSRVQSRYPSHTVCYLTNRLMAYINKREQGQYKDPGSYSGWKRPPVEEVLSKLSTYFVRVHSRLCIDEAELAEHVVGLTSSLASCQFRKKLTRLSVNANGLLIPKDCVDKALIKKNMWLKALIAIPKVQPRFAIAISKKYPTMKSLLRVYMDPSKSIHEKEFLLKDLTTEALLGDDRRLGEVCSKRVYRILMAQSGSIKTDDVEDGADFFNRQSS